MLPHPQPDSAFWHDLLDDTGLSPVRELLPAYLVRQRWFGARSRTISGVRVLDWVELPGVPAAIVFVEVAYAEGDSDTYQMPLALSSGAEASELPPASIVVGQVATADGPAILHDATAREDVLQALLAIVEKGERLDAYGANDAAGANADRASRAFLAGHRSSAFDAARGAGPLAARTGSAEQSNTSILYGQKLILKLFRRLQPGENPDAEIGRFLTEVARFPHIAPHLGEIRGQRSAGGEPTTLALLQGLVQNEGDGWEFTLGELARYYESVATLPAPRKIGAAPSFLYQTPAAQVPAEAREHAGFALDAAALLGRRTAEMHLALATPSDNPAFAPEPFRAGDLVADGARLEAQVTHALDALERASASLPGDGAADAAALVLARRSEFLARARELAELPGEEAGLRIRIHGDYHLGQVLRSGGDFVILDFEGEPARGLAERRAKQSPLRDVAGMLRSFSYAASFAIYSGPGLGASAAARLGPWARLWENAVSTEFLSSWRSTIAAWRPTIAANPLFLPEPEQGQRLLHAYLLEKALYELLYELDHRPAWVGIPLAGILSLPQ